MNDDALKKLWREQDLPASPMLSDEEQITALKRMKSFDRTITRRDYVEVAVCLILGIFFAGDLLFRDISALTQAGCLVLIASCGLIAWRLIGSKRRLPKAEPNAPVGDLIRAELLKVENQIGLLKSIAWWYLLPITVGLMMHFCGASAGLVANLVYFTIVLALDVYIWSLNQRAVKANLLPLKEELGSLLHSIETGEPFEAMQGTRQDPFASAMRASGKVQALEFKVAFWQLGIYGIPGIVGIWFFLTLGLTMSNTDWMVDGRDVSAPAPVIRAAETNETILPERHVRITRQLVELFNAGDYPAVRRLYNADMGKVFPPKETSDFYTGLAGRFGRIEGFDGPTGDGYRGWTAFRLYCQRGRLTMSLALDANDQIAGIYFKPMSAFHAVVPNIRPFLRQFFSGPHLVWGALSFLGGLLYTWLIQKIVKRAVGISALGIHLQNGMILIHWNEIEEVRPFRFLNIRNLFLIRKSGEKTRMHWSPLERHSDVKAAVEKFAPPNHPIREHLSLLRTKPTKKQIMTRIILIGTVLIGLGAIVLARSNEPKTSVIAPADPVSRMLETIRVKHNFPALAAAVIVDGKIVQTNAVGFRKQGGPEQVAVDDKFHIGSVTKSMTATVAAMLVEQGKLDWTKTVGESFPELKGEIHPDYAEVTLEQLLSHRGGAPGNAPRDLWSKAWRANGTAAEQRMEFVKGLLNRKPEAKPGTKFIYSNQGYTIAGVMLEKAAGKSWEQLMRGMLFEPLGMNTAGFGAPAALGKVDQPWGHETGTLSAAKPVPPGPRADNPLAISPAGVVHCSLADLAKYAAFHMAGERGESKLLKAESFKKLHTVSDGNEDYALGWVVLKRSWAGGRALMHNGSNTMFYIVVWMAPDKNSAVIVATNVGSTAAFKGCDEVAGKLINQYLVK